MTFVVVPDPCSLLSPELLYTALTRQQDRVVVLKQGDPATLRDLASPSRSETARRLTCLFRPADPFAIGDGTVLDGKHVHRTARGDDLVRSKSEVIVADALQRARSCRTATRRRWPSPASCRATPTSRSAVRASRRSTGSTSGMLDLAGYRADWEARKAWYAVHDILPWEDGGGAARRARLLRRERVSRRASTPMLCARSPTGFSSLETDLDPALRVTCGQTLPTDAGIPARSQGRGFDRGRQLRRDRQPCSALDVPRPASPAPLSESRTLHVTGRAGQLTPK